MNVAMILACPARGGGKRILPDGPSAHHLLHHAQDVDVLRTRCGADVVLRVVRQPR